MSRSGGPSISFGEPYLISWHHNSGVSGECYPSPMVQDITVEPQSGGLLQSAQPCEGKKQNMLLVTLLTYVLSSTFYSRNSCSVFGSESAIRVS